MMEPPVGVAYRDRSDDLRITSVSRALVAWFKARAGFMFTGWCWWRSLAVDGGTGTSRGHGHAGCHADVAARVCCGSVRDAGLRVGDAEHTAGADGQGGATADREGGARVGVAEVHVGEYRKARKAVLTGNDLLQQ